jgi:Xaa-Pro dipeptidase
MVDLGIDNGVIAVDPGTPWVIHESLRTHLPKATFRDASSLLTEARIIKNPDEVEAIRKACRIADTAIEAALAQAREGIPEFELAALVESEFRRNEAEFPSMMPCVFSGDHPRLGYICSSDRRLKSGELVRMDIGCAVDGYCSCIARTGFVGEPDDHLLETYDLLQKALRAGVESVRPGTTNAQVHEAMHEVLQQGSSGKYGLDWYGGHGVGLGLHEQPMIGRGGLVTEIVLQPGMVFALEPSILLPGMGWLGLEDDIVVTPDGSEVLSQAKFEL